MDKGFPSPASAMPAGSRLGPYEILGLLGAGGMGEVYRAYDPRLARCVAIKVLPEAVASDPRRLRLFEREARAAAALNHPNILDVHDIGADGDVCFVVYEMLEGTTLRDYLVTEGRLPVRKALDYAVQVSRGLAAAHEKGIVHRDLKPENLFITSDGLAKILDFGLAKQASSESEEEATSRRDTATQDTRPGVLVGTPGYMSPEQVRGEAADHRSDIFAFGSVFYEALTGRSAFGRRTMPETFAGILHDDAPNLASTGAPIPLVVDHIIHRCLEKRREDRFQSARDLGFAIEAVSPLPDQGSGRHLTALRRTRGRVWGMAVAAAVALGLITAAWWTQRETDLPTWAPRQITADPGWETEPALSPDGTLIAFSSDRGGNADIWIVDARGGDPLQLTTHPSDDRSPAWLADGSAVAFVSNRGGQSDLWRVPMLGGNPVRLLPDAENPALSPEGDRIAFSRRSHCGEHRIWVADLDDPASATQLTDHGDGLWDHVDPAWSPDGRTLSYADQESVWVLPSTGGTPRRLTHDMRYPRDPEWSADGRYVYFSSYADDVLGLWRIGRDGEGALRLTPGMGPETDLSLASDGRRLAYSSAKRESIIVVVDLTSGNRYEVGGVRSELGPTLSPDGTQMLYSSDNGGDWDIWRQRLEQGRPRGRATRLTDLDGNEMLPSYSPDGRWVAFCRVLEGERSIWVVGSDSGPPRRLTDPGGVEIHPAWSPDGKALAFISDRGGHEHLWVAPVENGSPAGPPRCLTSGDVTDEHPHWSPDGSQIVVRRSEGSAQEIWVVPVDGSAPPRQVTRGAMAGMARWRADGRSLLVSGTWGAAAMGLRIVWVSTGETRPVTPSITTGDPSSFGLFDVSKDGRFVAFVEEHTTGDIWVLEATNGRF